MYKYSGRKSAYSPEELYDIRKQLIRECDDLRRQVNLLEKELDRNFTGELKAKIQLQQLRKVAKAIVKEVNNPDTFNVPTPESRLGKAIKELAAAIREGGE